MAATVDNAATWQSNNPGARADTKTQIEIFKVQEIGGIKSTRGRENAPPHQHETAADNSCVFKHRIERAIGAIVLDEPLTK